MHQYGSRFSVSGMSKIIVERKMEQYLTDYCPSHLLTPGELNIVELLEFSLFQSHDFKLCLVKRLDPGIEARTNFDDRKIEVTESFYDALIKGNKRNRFTAAHEAAHVILHSTQFLNRSVHQYLTETIDYPVYKNPEWQADHGAGCLLMPRKTLIPCIRRIKKPTVCEEELYKEISRIFNVSLAAAKKRYVKINA